MAVMKIVCAPDSFKGSVTASEAAAAMAAGAAEVLGEATVVELPFADGGEGTLDALLAVWGQDARSVKVVDAIGRERTARWGLSADGRTAVIEAAEGNGLPAVSDVDLQPQRADTYGVGLIAREVLDSGAEEVLVCLGGSASTDGGAGILSALGAKFLDSDGAEVAPGGQGLSAVARVDDSGLDERAKQLHWRLAVDVDNPLVGERGAAAVFGPQKGATKDDVVQLDAALKHLAEILAQQQGVSAQEYWDAEGFGAAGGIPLALVSLLGAEVLPGSQMVAEAVGLAEELSDADLVLTGEGRLDTQSLGGKVVDAVQRYAPAGAAVVAIAGAVQLSAAECREAGLAAAFSIAYGPAELKELQADSAALIQATAAQATSLWASRG